VRTLAHELGHGVHFTLSRGQGIFHHTTALTVSETASVFGEAMTFARLHDAETEPSGRLALLAQNLEGSIGTVFRQIAMCRFEDRVHTLRRTDGELSIEQFNGAWAETQGELLGDAVEVTESYRSWWSYIPHFFHTPGYVYAYAFGQLLALSVYHRYLEEGASFVPRYLEMLAAGGRDTPESLAAIVGCDLGDPGFWDAGLDLVEQTLVQAEEAAVAADRA
jgi:oligoendopeptidase F